MTKFQTSIPLSTLSEEQFELLEFLFEVRDGLTVLPERLGGRGYVPAISHPEFEPLVQMGLMRKGTASNSRSQGFPAYWATDRTRRVFRREWNERYGKTITA